jgi:hypothetical protein
MDDRMSAGVMGDMADLAGLLNGKSKFAVPALRVGGWRPWHRLPAMVESMKPT